MQSFRQPDTSFVSLHRIQLPVAPEVAIGLSSLPSLSLLVIGHLIADGLVELGQQSEELFRGERLPSLPLMKPSTK